MRSPDQVPDKWSILANAYEGAFEPLSRQYAAETLRLLDLKPGERVIDVAAGTGAFSLLAARAGIEVLAVDFAPGMIARLRERAHAEVLDQVHAEVMDGQALSVADGAYDAGASILGLIFFPDIAQGLRELRRVVRPGGRVGIVCWSDPRNLSLMTHLVAAIRTVVPGFEPPSAPPVWSRLAGAAALREEMGNAGFEAVKITEAIGVLKVESPQQFWEDFTSSAPPLSYLFSQLGPECTEAVGRAYLDRMRAGSDDGAPTLHVEACIGIGRV
jgi:ubiquinone/menaquinone biosynthesis C-methylase UbiE